MLIGQVKRSRTEQTRSQNTWSRAFTRQHKIGVRFSRAWSAHSRTSTRGLPRASRVLHALVFNLSFLQFFPSFSFNIRCVPKQNSICTARISFWFLLQLYRCPNYGSNKPYFIIYYAVWTKISIFKGLVLWVFRYLRITVPFSSWPYPLPQIIPQQQPLFLYPRLTTNLKQPKLEFSEFFLLCFLLGFSLFAILRFSSFLKPNQGPNTLPHPLPIHSSFPHLQHTRP